MKYTWATATHVGHVRENNQDAVSPEADGTGEGPLVVAVADGMGGAAGGEVASRLAIDAAAGGAGAAVDPTARIEAGNRAVLEAVAEDSSLAGMGTTLSLGIFGRDGMLRIGHVGDSRIYVARDGQLEQLTDDHTYVMELVARGHLSIEDAADHPRRHLLSRVVGMAGLDVDEYTFELLAGDRIVFCSDGLTTMLSDDVIGEILHREESTSGAAWGLVEAANAAGGVDNTTVAVVDVGA